MARLMDLVAPRSWAGAWTRAYAIVIAIHLVNFTLVSVVPGLSYTLGDALICTFMAFPMFAGLMAALLRLRLLQGRLTVLATTDLLTGLPNRRAFMARARLATEGGRAGALLLLDADHFKRINDVHGHAAGDACLSAIAARLRASLRPGDLVGRLGGEEFGAFLPGATREEALAVGARLCASIAVDAAAAEEALAVTLSAGASLGDGATPLDRLMADADRALYEAKARGRAQVVVWPPGEAEGARAA